MSINNALYKILRPLFLFLTFLSIFKGIFNTLFKFKGFEYLDEIIFFLSLSILLPIFLLKQKLKIVYFVVVVFILYSIVISIFFGVNGNPLKIVLQTLITIKFYVIILALIELFHDDYKTLNRFFLYVVNFAILGLLIHLFFGIKFNHWAGISSFARPNIRYVGFFTHPNHLAYLMVIYIAYILNKKYIKNIKINIFDWLRVIFSTLGIVLADSRTAMLAVVLLLFAFYWKLIKKNFNIIAGGLLLGVLGLIYVYFYTSLIDSIMENIKDTLDLTSHYIRGNMIHLSGLILIDFFPIGTGAASFGSVLSDERVYALYGQADRYYFINEMGIYDSNIASVVGEYGLIGIFIFFAMFFYLVVYLKSFSQYKTLVVPFILMFLLYSITNPMLTNNFYSLLTSIILFLIVKEDDDKIIGD